MQMTIDFLITDLPVFNATQHNLSVSVEENEIL